MESTGEKLEKKRKEAGLERSELATMIGKSTMTVWRYEKDIIIIPADVLKKLSVIYECSLEELLADTDEARDDRMKRLLAYFVRLVPDDQEELVEIARIKAEKRKQKK